MPSNCTAKPAESRSGSASVAAFLLLVAVAGCGAQGPYVWARDVAGASHPGPVAIQPGDTLLVEVRNQREMSGEFVVRDDGQYAQPTLGNVPAAGVTPALLGSQLEGRLKGVLSDPKVTVAIARRAPIRVYVVGEVRTPGPYEMVRDRSVTAAVAAAGWVTEFASEDRIFLVRPAEQPARVRFRVADLTGAGAPVGRFPLRDGDVIVVE